VRSKRAAIHLPAPRPETTIEREIHDSGRRLHHECVWANGLDVTDALEPAKWPWPYRIYYEAGWRPWRSLAEPGSAYLPRET